MEFVEFCIEVKPVILEILSNYFDSQDFIKNITLDIRTFEVQFIDEDILKTGLIGFHVKNANSYFHWDAIYLYLSLDYYTEKIDSYETLPNASLTLDVNADIYNINSTLYFDYLSFPNNWTGIIKERNIILLNTEYYFSNKVLRFSNCNIYINLITSKMFKEYLRSNFSRRYKNNYVVNNLESICIINDTFFDDNSILNNMVYELESFINTLGVDASNEYIIKNFFFEFNYSFVDMIKYKEKILESLYLLYNFIIKNSHYLNVNLKIKVPLSESEMRSNYDNDFIDIIEKFKLLFLSISVEYGYLAF